MTTESLTTSQAARRLSLSYSRVRQLSEEGRIRTIRTPLGRLFDADEVERFARERELSAQS